MQRPGTARRELVAELGTTARIVVGLLALIALGVWIVVLRGGPRR